MVHLLASKISPDRLPESGAYLVKGENIMNKKESILNGQTALGIELGSTRIKGVLIDLNGQVLAVGIHDWENSFINNIWTYGIEEIHEGLRNCYRSLRQEVERKYTGCTRLGENNVNPKVIQYVMGRWMSSGHPFSADRSEAKTAGCPVDIRLAPTVAERRTFRCTDHNECLQSYCREVSRGE